MESNLSKLRYFLETSPTFSIEAFFFWQAELLNNSFSKSIYNLNIMCISNIFLKEFCSNYIGSLYAYFISNDKM